MYSRNVRTFTNTWESGCTQGMSGHSPTLGSLDVLKECQGIHPHMGVWMYLWNVRAFTWTWESGCIREMSGHSPEHESLDVLVECQGIHLHMGVWMYSWNVRAFTCTWESGCTRGMSGHSPGHQYSFLNTFRKHECKIIHHMAAFIRNISLFVNS